MGKSSQRKGRAAELQLAALLRESGFYGVTAAEPLNFGTVPDLYGLRGVHIECKRAERLNMTAALQQAATDAQRFQDGLPAVFHRRNREEWRVTMRLSDWMELYGKAVATAEKAREGAQ